MIALSVGQDLDESADRTVQDHLAGCVDCRGQAAKLETSLRALREAEVTPSFAYRDSLWPSIARQVEARRRAGLAEQFNGWVPALAVMAASVLIAVFWNQSTPVNDSWGPSLNAREMVVYEDREGRLFIDPSWADQPAAAFAKEPQAQWDSSGRSWSVRYHVPPHLSDSDF